MKIQVCVGLFALNAGLLAAVGAEDSHSVNVSVTAGAIDYEGDEAVRDSLLLALHVGVDWTEHWTLEGVLSVFPKLDENHANSYGTRVSRLRAAAGQDVHSTRAFGVAVDARYHFTRWERFDPYLCVGLGVMHYADDFDTQTEPVLRTGGGLLYHLTDRLSLRADLRILCAGPDTEVNALAGGGVMWTFRGPPTVTATTGVLDTDGDGLVDDAEIHTHRTNPLMRDTDRGGAADGHETIEDGTDPLAADDDLTFFELNMQFTDDGWEIRPEYFSDLDAIAAVLRDNPQATARIEGHTDRRANLSAWRTRRLTRRRAGAIAGYLERNWKIDGARLESVGYGFDRPKARDEVGKGNALNQRMEIYIRPKAR